VVKARAREGQRLLIKLMVSHTPAGGEYLLLEFRGMDATVPFESFHPFTDRHRKALARMKPVGTRDSPRAMGLTM
jgi:hypothetical protein